MKKILFVNGHMNVGGIEKTLLDLLQNIDASRYDVDLLLLESKGDYIDSVPSNINVRCMHGIDIEGPLLSSIWKNIKRLKIRLVLYRLILSLSEAGNIKNLSFLRLILPVRNRYDYAIAYRPGICADVVAYTIKSKKKYCWWHHGECGYSQYEIKKNSETWSHFDKVVTVSDGCRGMLRTMFPLLADKITKLHNMLCVNQLNIMAGNVNPYEQEKDTFIFVSVSRLYVEKHTENVVWAAAEIRKKKSLRFKWYIIGDGILYSQIKDEITKYELEDCVFLLGKKDNPYPYIKYADLLIHTSYVEAQCTTVLEGMALGTPCIMTKTTNPQDFTKDRYNCILVDQNIRSLVDGIDYATSNISEMQTISRNAYQTVKEFSPEKVIAEFERLIENGEH